MRAPVAGGVRAPEAGGVRRETSGRPRRLGDGTCGTRVVAGSTAGTVDGRGGTTGSRSVSPSVAGTRTAPGYAECAAGRAAVARTCVLAGSPAGRIGATTGTRDVRASGSCAVPVERDGTTGTRDVTPSDSEAEAPFGRRRTTGTRAVRHSGSDAAAPVERPGQQGGETSHRPGRPTRAAASDPDGGRARIGSPSPPADARRRRSRGTARASRGSARAAGPERSAPGSHAHPVRRPARRWSADAGRQPPGGWAHPCTGRCTAAHSACSCRHVRVGRSCAPPRPWCGHPCPCAPLRLVQDLSVRHRATTHSPCAPAIGRHLMITLSAIRLSAFHQSAAITQTDQDCDVRVRRAVL